MNKKDTKNTFSEKPIRFFKDIASEWLEQKRYSIKESTYIKYRNLLIKNIFPEFGDLSTQEYSIFRFEAGLQNISEAENHRYSKSTMKSILYIVRTVIRYGTRHSYNSDIDIIFEFTDTKPKECAVLTKEEEENVINAVSKTLTKNNLGILLSLTTGLRIGEVCALKRENIDFDTCVVYVCETVQRLQSDDGTKLIVNPPKSKKSIRYVPLPQITMTYFKKLKIQCMPSDHYIFTNSLIPYEPRTLQYAFKSVLRKCKIEDRNFHSLRHTFATNCVELGFDVKTLSEILGHSSVTFTLNRYVHSSLTQKKKQMGLLDKKYCIFS